MNFNINFCLKQNKGFDYCYNNCNKTCPTVSNIWYGYVIIPLNDLWRVVLNKFIKCDKLPTKCSFLFCKKYCVLKGKCN